MKSQKSSHFCLRSQNDKNSEFWIYTLLNLVLIIYKITVSMVILWNNEQRGGRRKTSVTIRAIASHEKWYGYPGSIKASVAINKKEG